MYLPVDLVAHEVDGTPHRDRRFLPLLACAAMRRILLVSLLWILFVSAAPVGAEPDAAGVYTFSAARIDGREEVLETYRGKVLLIVNVASRCGYTPQYEALQELYDRYNERGLAILGFPSNDFAAQEPGTNGEIAQFCRMNYGVEFPMFSKVRVVGDEAHPLYRYLAARPAPVGGPIEWNFQKYLVTRDGEVVEKFPSATEPDDPALVQTLESLLGAQG